MDVFVHVFLRFQSELVLFSVEFGVFLHEFSSSDAQIGVHGLNVGFADPHVAFPRATLSWQSMKY